MHDVMHDIMHDVLQITLTAACVLAKGCHAYFRMNSLVSFP